jgi:hypothetical protein
MKTKLEAALIMLNMAQTETDDAKRDALLVGIHHTVRRKLQEQRNRASRTARGLKPFIIQPPFDVQSALAQASQAVAKEA